MTQMEMSTQLVNLEDNLERFALSLTSNREEAKDLLQETYLKALTYTDHFVEYTNLKAWVCTIMRNIFINNYRRSVREYTRVDYTQDLFFINNTKESQLVMPDSDYAFKEINLLVDEMEDEFKIPFRMHTEGYKYREIAETLGLKIGTVKSRIFFMRKKLMEALQDYQ